MAAQADSSLPDGRVRRRVRQFPADNHPQAARSRKDRGGQQRRGVSQTQQQQQHAYVTFGGGGLFVVDITTEPMSIVAEYTNDVISVAGCGGVEGRGFMHLNAGVSASPAGADDSTFIMYRLPLDYPDGANPHTTPNTPPVVKFHEEKTLDITDATELSQRRDAHGVTISVGWTVSVPV